MALCRFHVHFHGGGFVLGSALSGQFDGMLVAPRRSEAVLSSPRWNIGSRPSTMLSGGVEDSYAALVAL